LSQLAAEDPLLKNSQEIYDFKREDMFERQMKVLKRVSEVLPTLPFKMDMAHFNEIYV